MTAVGWPAASRKSAALSWATITTFVVQGRDRARSPLVTLVAALAIAVMAVVALADIIRHPDAALVKSDFAAFYCGSVVTIARRDPYALSPLRICESGLVDLPGHADPAEVGIDPDPMPGYSMAFFAPFTVLPYREAALIWDALLVAAIAATAALVATMTGLPFLVTAAVLAFVDGALSIPYGQIPPMLTLGLALAGYGLWREQRALVVAGALLSMIEPHIGLPACCAIFVWRPGLRRDLVALAAALVAVSLAALGTALNIEYARVELPAHAMAEATTSIQYSLAWLLHFAGVPDGTAIRLAAFQYSLFALAGVALAGPVARRLQMSAAIALFPPTLVLIGGTFVHIQQMTAAVPFALLVATRLRGWSAGAAWFAVALLAVPWPLGSHIMTVGAVAVVATIVLVALSRDRLVVALGAALAGALLYVAIAGPVLPHIVPAFPRHILGQPAPMPRALDGDRLASEQDAREVRTSETFALATPRTLAIKLPTWLALGVIACVTLAALRTGPGSSKSATREDRPFAPRAKRTVRRVSRSLVR